MPAPAFPKWLPPAVAREAERILDRKNPDAALVHRLVTDERMKSVWRELTKPKDFLARPQISEPWANMRGPLPDEDNALTLFFWCAYLFGRAGIIVGTAKEYDAMLATYRKQAEQLRASALVLRDLHLVSGLADNFLQYGDISKQSADIHANQIEDAANFCDEIVEAIIELKAADPLIVDRDYGNREARGYVRLMSIEMHRLFGQLMAGTLATVASVALEIEIADKQVRNWAGPTNKVA
jgi:hypothetical protein